jgi:hypothetical protein
MRFVDWQRVNAIYCGVIWTIALALVVAILVECVPQSTTPAHRAAPVLVR